MENPPAETPERHALRMLATWIPAARRHLYRLPGSRRGEICYGIGNSGHWAQQANGTAFTAFSALATVPGADHRSAGMSRDALIETALGMLRFALEGHHAGGGACTDGKTWGHSWISALCIERMMHGVEALWAHLDSQDRARLRRVLLSEAAWLLDEYPVTAGLVENNHPESNMWNGTFLHRVAFMYPRAERVEEYREKGTRFLLNAISVPADASDGKVIAGRPVKEWHLGANFFDTYACNHHGYLNLGYIYITLSNLAMFHFSCRTRGWTPPPELYHRAGDLWRLAKSLTFDDGRLLRIGGDTRVRYCYCQDYALPVWLLAQDWLGDSEAAGFEAGWLRQVEREQVSNTDGSFLGNRLRRLEQISPLYYVRLEGDRAGTLSMVARWREQLDRPKEASARPPVAPLLAWSDAYHGASFVKGPRRVASWVWAAGEGPTGLCLETGRSDQAEWRLNLAGEIAGLGMVNRSKPLRHSVREFHDGFTTGGRYRVTSQLPAAEGDQEEDVADVDIAFAALPDGSTVVVLQRARTLHRVFTRVVKGLHLMIPNDLHNGGVRRYSDAAGNFRTKSRPGRQELLLRGSHWLNIDGSLGLRVLAGADQVILHRPAQPQVGIKVVQHRPMVHLAGGMLYADEICLGACELEPTCHDGGALLFDFACALRTGLSAKATARWAEEESSGRIAPLTPAPEVRAVRVTGADGRAYLVAANFGDKPTKVEFAGHAIRVGGGKGLTHSPTLNRFNVRMDSGEAVLCELVGATG